VARNVLRRILPHQRALRDVRKPHADFAQQVDQLAQALALCYQVVLQQRRPATRRKSVRNHGAEGDRRRLLVRSGAQLFLERYTRAHRAEIDAFVTGVLDGKPLNPTGEDGLKALVLADAANESVKSGKSVRVG